jgi:DNA polymerase I-like protein with 3'-5' exonuclease and polymerase domains
MLLNVQRQEKNLKVTIDVETSTYNKGHPFDPRNKLVSYAYKPVGNPSRFRYFSDPDFITDLRNNVESATELVGFSFKFDLHWSQRVGVRVPADCRIWDCALAEFVISGQTARFISLNEALESYGEPRKPDLVAEYWACGISTEDIPLDILEEYNLYDTDGTYALYCHQQSIMDDKQKRLVYLMGEDLKALQHAEYAGVKWNKQKATERQSDLEGSIEKLEESLKTYLPEIPQGVHFNWDSGDQVSALLYGGEIEFEWAIPTESVYKSGERVGQSYTKNSWRRELVRFTPRFVPLEGTEVAKTAKDPEAKVRFYQTDAPTIKQLTSRRKESRDLLRLLLERSELIKVSEMIASITNKSKEMNWENDYIHGQFNQNVAVTGRLSSSGPNLQNTPVEVDELLVSRYD